MHGSGEVDVDGVERGLVRLFEHVHEGGVVAEVGDAAVEVGRGSFADLSRESVHLKLFI